MSSRAQRVLTSRQIREQVIHWINIAPEGTRVELKPPQRTPAQNDKMWACLTDICIQSPKFNGAEGRKYTTDEAKVIFLHAVGQEIAILPTLDGKGFIPYGQSSSDLSVAEMSDLIEFLHAWGAEQNPPIAWSDPKEKALLKAAEERAA